MDVGVVEGTASAQPKDALHDVLDWLFAAKVPPTEAFACAKAFITAGVCDRSAIAALSPEQARSLAPPKLHKKLLSAIRRMPTLQQEADAPAAAKRSRPDPSAPPPPPAPDGPRAADIVRANRSPVMVVWAAVVAERMSFDWSESLSLASAVAAACARAKGRRIGVYSDDSEPPLPEGTDTRSIALLGQNVPACRTADGWRGLAVRSAGDRYDMVMPIAVFRNLERAFGDHFGAVVAALRGLSEAALTAEDLHADHGRAAYALYTEFRPAIADGIAGWGQKGDLDLRLVEAMASRCKPPDPKALLVAIAQAGPDGVGTAALAAALARPDDQTLRDAIAELQLVGDVYEVVGGGRFAIL